MAVEHKVDETGEALKEGAGFGASVLHRHGWRLLLAFACVVLPLWGFGAIAEDIGNQEVIPFDAPILQFAHSHATATYDRFFVFMTSIGYVRGVVPADVVLVLALAAFRRKREAVFAALAMGGSALANVVVKQIFARARPSLWDSIAPETTFSFPSGHAMGSATLACVLIALSWNTRWRWSVLVLAVGFAAAVGLSRVYLGVHYPSDILAGWAAASAWTVAVYMIVFRNTLRPWATAQPAVQPSS